MQRIRDQRTHHRTQVYRHCYRIVLVLLMALFLTISNFGATPVYATSSGTLTTAPAATKAKWVAKPNQTSEFACSEVKSKLDGMGTNDPFGASWPYGSLNQFKTEGLPSTSLTTYTSIQNAPVANPSITMQRVGNGLSWTSNFGIDFVLIKGGTAGTNIYIYVPEGTSGGTLTTPNGQDISNVKFCWDTPKSIKVVKKDQDGDPLANWQFTATNESTNVVYGPVTTNSNGEAIISGLPYGEYNVCEIPQAGWTPVSGYSACEDVTVDSDTSTNATQTSDDVSTQTGGGSGYSTYYFKNKQVRDVTVYKKDPSGNILGGWEFKLRKYGSSTVLATKTTTTGNPVTFTGLDVGTKYVICETKQSGWTVQSPTDSNGCQTITLPSGSGAVEMVFVNTPPTRDIKIIKKDQNYNRLEGWQFTARNKSTNQTYGPVTTNSNGEARFEDLPFGTYEVCETLQSGWVAVNPSDGCSDITLNSSTTTSSEQTSDETSVETGGGSSNTLTFYNMRQVRKIKVVKKDNNNNGLQNWQIKATNTATGEIYGPVTTNGSGYAYIDNLPFGTYDVCEIPQSGWTPAEGYAECRRITIDNSTPTGSEQTSDETSTQTGGGSYLTVTFKNRPTVPSIEIKKYTYGGNQSVDLGADADSATGSDVPQIVPGQLVVWHYVVHNNGEVAFDKSKVTVTDDQADVTVAYDSEITGNGDSSLDPGEKWLYKATGTAKTLAYGLANTTIVDGCKTSDDIARPVYENKGKVQITDGPSDDDYSHYCNPEDPKIAIKKYTYGGNQTTGYGADADSATGSDVPQIVVGQPVAWYYLVENTGDVPFPQSKVAVSDDQAGVSVMFDSVVAGDGGNVLDPGEKWLYKATGSALELKFGMGGVTVVEGCKTTTGLARPVYENKGKVQITGGPSATDLSHYCNPELPGIEIKKYTNGADADDPNGNDVPKIDANGAIVWTYVVANTGNVPFLQASVVVTDNREVNVTFDKYLSGDTDDKLEPGEKWQYKATGNAHSLTANGAAYIVDGCQVGEGLPRPTYNNSGFVTISGYAVNDNDPSHYCNPEGPNIAIRKYTNGADANDPNGSDVPKIASGEAIEWTYVVSNTGNVPFAKSDVVVSDNRKDVPAADSVLPAYASEVLGNGDEVLDPGEMWLYKATGSALNLTSGGAYTVNGCMTAQGLFRPTYQNTGKVTVNLYSLTATDASHYCNPERPGVAIKKYTNGADADNPNGSANGNDVPQIEPNGAIEWTYVVENTGNVPFTKDSVVVSDNLKDIPVADSVVPSYASELSGNGDEVFGPGERWLYKATGSALTLTSGTAYVVDGCQTGQALSRPTYANIGTVSITGTQLTANDPSHYCNPERPGIAIKKYTNGADADDPNGSDVPRIAPDGDIVWTYVVSNTGNVPYLKGTITVSDDRGVAPQYASEVAGDGDEILEPGERWLYSATGKAQLLEATASDVVEGCLVGESFKRPTYNNTGTVAVQNGPADSDLSHYCNPTEAEIVIKKYTNGEDADTPTGPTVTAGSTVTWSYVVTNPGNVPLSNVVVTDNVAGVTPLYISGDSNNNGKLDVSETWLYRTTGTAITGQYANTGYVQGTTPEGTVVTDDDPSHYYGAAPEVAALGDRVWHDLNFNGLQEKDEPGVPGVTVNLLAGDCITPMNRSDVTDANGIYGFEGLTPGSYCVHFDLTTLPAGYKVSPQNVGDDGADSDGDVTLGKSQSVTLAGSTQNLTVDLGIYYLASLGNRVWVDSNLDGVQDGNEQSVEGVKVTLFTCDGQQVGEPQLTGPDGAYLFSDLTPGCYYVIFDPATLPEGYTFTKSHGDGISDDLDSDADANGQTPNVTIQSGDSYVDLDAGIVPPTVTTALAELGDLVWYDLNKNGLQENGEAGVAGVKVDLYTATGDYVKSTLTDANGFYLFTDLEPGSYYVEFATVQGYNFTRHNIGGAEQNGADSDPLLPWLEVTIGTSAKAELGKALSYTFFYTNTDAALAATNVVISTTIPAGTSFVGASSDAGWVCADGKAGTVCTLTVPNVAANTSGSATFTVMLDASEPNVPDLLDIVATVTQGSLARTEVITLAEGESNRTLDAGLVRLGSSLTTTTPTAPTNLPGEEQPAQQEFVFLPTLHRHQ